MNRPACTDADPADFFPDTRGNNGTDPYYRARVICRECAVRPACLDEALEVEGNLVGHGRYGMYGALDPDERAALARKGGRR